MNKKDKENNYQYYIDILNTYKINESLKEGNIFHLYSKENAFPDGYYDSKFFDLHIYNTKTHEKRIVKNRDGLMFNKKVKIDIIRIYIDGSYFLRLKNIEPIDIFQCCMIGEHMNVLTKEEILKNKIAWNKIKRIPMIYFLIDKDEIVYVGKTYNIKSRLHGHLSIRTRDSNKKTFDFYYCFECKKEELDDLESYYQILFQPKYNIRINNVKRYNKIYKKYFLKN